MSTLTVDIFISADGYARGEDSPAYFGYLGPDLERWIGDQGSTRQIALMGRVTYEALSAIPEEVRDEGWDQMMQTETVVFSRTLTATTWPNARVRADLVPEVTRLKKESDVGLYTIGSVSLARQLTDAGLVDRLRLMTFPLVVGPSGREPFFAGLAANELELVAHSVLDDRIVLTEYRTTGRDIPRA
ncbi:dihydrofolate reductase family protein [Jiangella mangrovi]|uniref:Dihydrofolate reductase n=1 Tax=Jiangella mangrovi TaxID=1524084 RepID=A0A7W9GRU6_9ACTN|nr:dihydrofolate reductase family protein [Jiangella mangrovi]MBB5788883.1 dihydrofolate reductase [Jiangella mangrovi]